MRQLSTSTNHVSRLLGAFVLPAITQALFAIVLYYGLFLSHPHLPAWTILHISALLSGMVGLFLLVPVFRMFTVVIAIAYLTLMWCVLPWCAFFVIAGITHGGLM